MVSMTPRKFRSAVIAALVVVMSMALPGCAKPADPKEAIPHYDAVLAEVTQVMESAWGPYKRDSRGGGVRLVDKQCLYDTGSASPAKHVRSFIYNTPAWEGARQKLADILGKHGFSNQLKPVVRGGVPPTISEKDSAGATIEINNDGRVLILGVWVDAPTCTDEALGLG